jgi:hypothetical protein
LSQSRQLFSSPTMHYTRAGAGTAVPCRCQSRCRNTCSGSTSRRPRAATVACQDGSIVRIDCSFGGSDERRSSGGEHFITASSFWAIEGIKAPGSVRVLPVSMPSSLKTVCGGRIQQDKDCACIGAAHSPVLIASAFINSNAAVVRRNHAAPVRSVTLSG